MPFADNQGVHLLMGNEAIARGALEAGVHVATGYPGTPSSEIIEALAAVADKNLYVEWSINEKVALEVAAAASFAGLRSLCAMKQNGVNVASDFLLHLSGSGTRGGIVLVSCDDPGAFSSMNEGDSRYFAKLVEIPLLEPASFQQAKDMTKWAFDLSETLKTIVMIRSVTRLSHSSGTVVTGVVPAHTGHAVFEHNGSLLDTVRGPVTCAPVVPKHKTQQKTLKKAKALFEESSFNTYEGVQTPDLLIITSSVCRLYCKEARRELGLESTVGILTIGTTWPVPSGILKEYLSRTDTILVVEEVLPFLEENVKIIAAESASEIGVKSIYGKSDHTIPAVGEVTPDIVIRALSSLCRIPYSPRPEDYARKVHTLTAMTVDRGLTFCPGCPHRASFWSIYKVLAEDDRKGFVCGDIGCYTLNVFGTARALKTIHSMGSGLGLASGFGSFQQFGMDQPVLAVCGDSTFFHAVIPALINAVHHKSNIVLIVLDNGGTAMTGFQPHPGLPVDAVGRTVPAVDVAGICKSVGAHVVTVDPFNLKEAQKTLKTMIESEGTHVLILRQSCALNPEEGKKKYKIYTDSQRCIGKNDRCGRPCTRLFSCPALVWNKEEGRIVVDEAICTGCGVCADICTVKAIRREEVFYG
jgi:indolepyruvate ferredoxin oxidoreductase alpha subunit